LSGCLCGAADNSTIAQRQQGNRLLFGVDFGSTIAHFLPALSPGLQLLALEAWGSWGAIERFYKH
jgi:hypothetical protein